MKHLLVIVGILVASFVGASLSSPSVLAIDSADLRTQTNCQTEAAAVFTGNLFSIPVDTYDVYVKLAKRGQSAQVSASAQVNDDASECRQIGAVEASGDEWRKIGTWEQGIDTYTTFEVSSDELGSALDAQRPSVMLVANTEPVCIPQQQCEVTVDGAAGYVLPPGSLATSDSLKLVRVVDPAQDTITKVVYYVDEEPMYTTTSLEDFDLRFVTYNNQMMERVIEYASGQRIVLTSMPPAGFHDTFTNFLFRIVNNSPGAVITAVVIIGAAIVISIALAVSHAIHRRHAWRVAHGFIKDDRRPLTEAEQLRSMRLAAIFLRIRHGLSWGVLAAGMIAVIVLVNTGVTTLIAVDGHSMESTYKTGNQLLVNKVPVTWAHSRGVQHIPARGQVVILRPVYGIVDPQTAASETSYVVKRVIGLPGERVVVRDGVVTIYNKQKPEGFNPDLGSSWEATMHRNDPLEDVELTLGSDELFISGDNRPESVDSRFNGAISTRQLVGIVMAKLW